MGNTVQQLRERHTREMAGINMKNMRSIGKKVKANSSTVHPMLYRNIKHTLSFCKFKIWSTYIPSNADNLIIQECQQIFMIRGYRLRSDLQLQLFHISLPLELLESVHDWFLQWHHNPKWLHSHDIDCFIMSANDTWMKHDSVLPTKIW